MKKLYFALFCFTILLLCSTKAYTQKKSSPENKITMSELESYVTFLASPSLKGRKDGDESLDIAANFISTQARLTGLKPASGNSYLQPYPIIRKTMDPARTTIQIVPANNDTITIKDPFYQLIPTGPSDLKFDGEVVFAGYGIKSDKYKYNDFADVETAGKIILIMNRAPMSEDGKKCQFSEPNWTSTTGFQMKIQGLISTKAKAILVVPDPKSGFMSFAEAEPGLADYLNASVTLASEKESTMNAFMQGLPKLIFISRNVADKILEGTGHSLAELQKSIDSSLSPKSFQVTDKKFRLTEVTMKEEKILNNVAAYIEGRDPVLKNEIVVFSAHYDHIGAAAADKVNCGADDNASGCAALLAMADAFQNMPKKPMRSILFLWVSGEEIGLFGSQWYVNHPLFPLDKTVADLNMDMIGRTKSAADSTSATPMTGPNSVFVITDYQSKQLNQIANEVDKTSPIDFDYSLSGRNHPLQLFARSDHFNFVKKDIPILFFSTGLHTDYHTPRDITEKIDFSKMELVTRTMFRIGLIVANNKTRPVVDNPYSKWNKTN